MLYIRHGATRKIQEARFPESSSPERLDFSLLDTHSQYILRKIQNRIYKRFYFSRYALGENVQLEISGFGKSNLDAISEQALNETLVYVYELWKSGRCQLNELFVVSRSVIESEVLFSSVIGGIFRSQYTFVSYLFELKSRQR